MADPRFDGSDLRDAAGPIRWPLPYVPELVTRLVLPDGEDFMRVVSVCIHAALIETTAGFRIIEADVCTGTPMFGPLVATR